MSISPSEKHFTGWPLPPSMLDDDYVLLRPTLKELLIEQGFVQIDKGKRLSNLKRFHKDLAATCCYRTLLRKANGKSLRTEWRIAEDMVTVLIWGPSDRPEYERFPITDEAKLAMLRKLAIVEEREIEAHCNRVLHDSETDLPSIDVVHRLHAVLRESEVAPRHRALLLVLVVLVSTLNERPPS